MRASARREKLLAKEALARSRGVLCTAVGAPCRKSLRVTHGPNFRAGCHNFRAWSHLSNAGSKGEWKHVPHREEWPGRASSLKSRWKPQAELRGLLRCER